MHTIHNRKMLRKGSEKLNERKTNGMESKRNGKQKKRK